MHENKLGIRSETEDIYNSQRDSLQGHEGTSKASSDICNVLGTEMMA